MRPGVPAWLAICVAIAAPGSARAQEPGAPKQRQVAVIDLSADDQVRDLSFAIYKVLNQSDVLRNPDKREFDQYLTGPLFDEDRQAVDNARTFLGNAERQLFVDNKNAEAQARSGQHELARVAPTSEVQALYADLTLVAGLADLELHKTQEANLAFAEVHRLDPARQLDPVRYPADTIAAYARAVDAKPAAFPLTIKGEGRVWIDFVERGPAPGTFEGLEAGEHLVVVTGAELVTKGEPVTITGVRSLELSPEAASAELLVKRARLELSRAQARHDDVARAVAMNKLAKLLGVSDAVMISKRDGQLQWETWKDRAPGFSAPKLITNQKPEELLEGLAPPKQIEPPKQPPPPIKLPPIVVEKAWYEQRWVQASAAVTAVGAIVGVILWARRDKMQGFDPDIKPAAP